MTTKAPEVYTNFKFKKDDTILFGRESAGVPKRMHNLVKNRLKIPMKKNLRSLNISSAVAIASGEACRQLKLF